MFGLLENLPWVIGTLVLVSLFISFSVAGVFVVRHFVSIKTLKAHHDVAGFVFTNLGVLYAVLLGFTVVNVQQRFDKIKFNAQTEASYLAELYLNAAVFPKQEREIIKNALVTYATSVIHDEWDMMAKGKSSPKTTKTLSDLWNAYYKYAPNSYQERAWYTSSIERLNMLTQTRLARLLESQSSLGQEMWALLILGGIVMVAFMWFFGLERMSTQMLMASILAATTAFLLFLIFSLDTVFSGEVSISPSAMQEILKTVIESTPST